MNAEVIRSKNFVADAAKFILELANDSLRERNQFRVALSGGNTPRPIYREWGRVGKDLSWDQIVITFGDERCVPPDDQQSNYRMARESLIEPAKVPDKSVLRMQGEIEPARAAKEYESQLGALAAKRQEKLYQHDLILLGMGDDGHTASLFPGTEALNVTDRSVMANFVPKFNTWRLTMTFPMINHARNVCFLINAAKNPELIDRVIAGDTQYPSARVKPTSGRLTWFLGEAA
jgi:6-phosphogluconolactonase